MKRGDQFDSKMPITWCPGCPNNVLLYSLKSALVDLIKAKKIKKKNVVIVTDIGCSGKIYDYLDLNAFYGLHGRAIPIALGIKLGNPKLTVIAVAGDGGTYSEGLNHLSAAGRLNPDITLIVINNGVLALTKGQATPTKQNALTENRGESPLDPIALALASQASFVSRETTFNSANLQETLKAAINHKGFSFIDVTEPCLSYNNNADWLKKNILRIPENYYKKNAGVAKKKDSKVQTGVFRKTSRLTLENRLLAAKTKDKKQK
jgi:2-oxoglutarate ferredoxin oxidoreductase subunit beta